MLFIKRIISLLISLMLIFNVFLNEPEYSISAAAEGAIFGGEDNDSINVELDFDTKWLTTDSNRIYNGRLAAFSALLCTDSYYRAKDDAKGIANRIVIDGSEYSQTALLEKFGYTDVRYIESFKMKQYATDSNDSVTMMLAYKNIDNKYDSFIVVFRGVFSAGERLSAFDAGALSDEYTSLTGQHSEWRNKSRFKGIDIAVSRAFEFIDEYMAEHDGANRTDTVLVTGHSRGGAIANAVGADFEDAEKARTYTYTFEAMPVTNSSNAGDYKTVFNILNENDYYTDPLPFGSEHFSLYGQTLSFNTDENDVYKKAIADLKGRSDYACLSIADKQRHDELFSAEFPDRNSLYDTVAVTETFDNTENAQQRIDEINYLISGLGLKELCNISDTVRTPDGKCEFTLSYRKAALINSIVQIEAYGEAAYDGVVSLFYKDGAFCELAEIINDNIKAINNAHLMIIPYVFCIKNDMIVE